MTSRLFLQTRDINGYNGFGLPFTTDSWITTLTTDIEQTLTVPSNYANWIAVMGYSPDIDIFVYLNETAVGTIGSFVKSTARRNPLGCQVQSGDVLHFITSNTGGASLSVTFYALPNTN